MVMNQETANYIVRYFPQLYNEKEKRAIEHKLTMELIKTPEQLDAYKTRYGDNGAISEDIHVVALAELCDEDFNLVVASRILNDHLEHIKFNLCKRCKALARTPFAKQCRHCGYDWH